ncbi:MAG: TonB-dependent receptor, partial [Pedobacter sp.]
VIPNPDIKPEYTYNVDLGFDGTIAKKIRWDLSVFYTVFRNAITLAPYSLNGQDSIVYNGTRSQVVANQNLNKAHMYGFNARLSVEMVKNLLLYTTVSYTKGNYDVDEKTKTNVYQKQADGTYALTSANVNRKPMDHIPPVFGMSGIEYNHKKIGAEVFAQYFGWKRLDEYNADGEDNPQYATADGMPSWVTLNLRASFQFSKYVQLQAAVENITDRNYRYFLQKYDYYLSPYLETYTFCLLPNHFHLLVRIKNFADLPKIEQTLRHGQELIISPERIISEQFRRFFVSYAKSIKVQEERTGSLFEKNFRRKLVDSDEYFTNLVAYIHRNPETHGI